MRACTREFEQIIKELEQEGHSSEVENRQETEAIAAPKPIVDNERRVQGNAVGI